MGTNGQFNATVGDENLRVIRGNVNPDGTVAEGNGFTVSHLSTGSYTINFSVPFSLRQTITVTAVALDAGQFPAFHLANVGSFSITSVHIITLQTDGSTHVDAPFNFVAIGPH